jgi:hypothetical protein
VATDHFTAVDVTVTFTVLTTSSILDGSLVEFGAALENGIELAARAAASDALHGVPGRLTIVTESREIHV